MNFHNLDHERYLKFENAFMFCLPRLCEHCLNPAVSHLALQARFTSEMKTELCLWIKSDAADGAIVSPDVRTRKSTSIGRPEGPKNACFCYPGSRAALPTLCAESCVGRIRYMGCSFTMRTRSKQQRQCPMIADVYQAHFGHVLESQ